jgi:histidyl-tRNA synthetase
MHLSIRKASKPCGGVFIGLEFSEIVIPAIWECETFLDKLGSEKERQMWTFLDRGDRKVALIPEVTGIIQQLWRDSWSKEMREAAIFYVSRCYRYERPQAGRYREFTQIGVEILGNQPGDGERAVTALKFCLESFSGDFNFVASVKRGLSYYVSDGFEVECPSLGAQKQVAGGGRYAEGVGWAIGLERLLMAEASASP